MMLRSGTFTSYPFVRDTFLTYRGIPFYKVDGLLVCRVVDVIIKFRPGVTRAQAYGFQQNLRKGTCGHILERRAMIGNATHPAYVLTHAEMLDLLPKVNKQSAMAKGFGTEQEFYDKVNSVANLGSVHSRAEAMQVDPQEPLGAAVLSQDTEPEEDIPEGNPVGSAELTEDMVMNAVLAEPVVLEPIQEDPPLGNPVPFGFFGLTFYWVGGSWVAQVIDFLSLVKTRGDRRRAVEELNALFRGPHKTIVAQLVSRTEIVGTNPVPTRVADYTQLSQLLKFAGHTPGAALFRDEAAFRVRVRAASVGSVAAVIMREGASMDVPEASIAIAEAPVALRTPAVAAFNPQTTAVAIVEPETTVAAVVEPETTAVAVVESEDAGPHTLE
jgi:hypothetical protein